MKIKNLQITNNLTLRIISLILAFLLWSILSQQQVAIVNKKIPIAFYNVQDNIEISASEHINAKVSGLRKDLWFNQSNAVHINSDFITEEKEYELSIYPEHIFLRQGLNLISYTPSKIKIKAFYKKDE